MLGSKCGCGGGAGRWLVWILSGYCLDTVWILSRYCLDSVWILSGYCLSRPQQTVTLLPTGGEAD